MKIKANREKLVASLREKDYNVITSECNWVHTSKLNFNSKFKIEFIFKFVTLSKSAGNAAAEVSKSRGQQS